MNTREQLAFSQTMEKVGILVPLGLGALGTAANPKDERDYGRGMAAGLGTSLLGDLVSAVPLTGGFALATSGAKDAVSEHMNSPLGGTQRMNYSRFDPEELNYRRFDPDYADIRWRSTADPRVRIMEGGPNWRSDFHPMTRVLSKRGKIKRGLGGALMGLGALGWLASDTVVPYLAGKKWGRTPPEEEVAEEIPVEPE